MTRRKDRYQPLAASASQPKTLKRVPRGPDRPRSDVLARVMGTLLHLENSCTETFTQNDRARGLCASRARDPVGHVSDRFVMVGLAAPTTAA
jgi:hypothetical protein